LYVTKSQPHLEWVSFQLIQCVLSYFISTGIRCDICTNLVAISCCFLHYIPQYAVISAHIFPSVVAKFSRNVTIFGLFHVRSTKNSWFEIIKYKRRNMVALFFSNMYHLYYKSKFRMVFLSSSSSSPWNNISHENVHIILY